jgi:hypothetical protein
VEKYLNFKQRSDTIEKNMKKLLLILTCITGFLWMYSAFASTGIAEFKCSGMSCFLAGVKDAGDAV